MLESRVASTPEPTVSPRRASLLLLPLAGFLAATLTGVWLSVRTADDTVRFAATEVPVLRHAFLALVVIVVVGIIIEGLVLNRWPLSVTAISGSVLLILTVAMLLLEEVAASLLPTAFLPTSVRRLSVDVYGGPGAWTGLVASGLVVIASRTRGGIAGVAARLVGMTRCLPLQWLIALLLAATSVALAAWARYQPWAVGSVGTRRVEVPGWALPVVGPMSLVAVLAFGAAATVLMVHRNLLASLLLAAAGWALSFLAALTLLIASTLARVDVERVLPSAFAQFKPSVEARWGAWVMFATGCVAAACGVALVRWHEKASTQ